MLRKSGKLPFHSPCQSSCGHLPGLDSSFQPKKPRPKDVHQLLLSHCQEAARGIKHDVTGRQLPSYLLSAPCPCMRAVIAGTYISAASLQLLETDCTLQEIHYSEIIPCLCLLRPAGNCGGKNHTPCHTIQPHHSQSWHKKKKIQMLSHCDNNVQLIPKPKFPRYLYGHVKKK